MDMHTVNIGMSMLEHTVYGSWTYCAYMKFSHIKIYLTLSVYRYGQIFQIAASDFVKLVSQ